MSLVTTGTRTVKITFPAEELSIKINKCTGAYLLFCFVSSYRTPPPSNQPFCKLVNVQSILAFRVQSWGREIGAARGVSGGWGEAFITSHSGFRDHILHTHIHAHGEATLL